MAKAAGRNAIVQKNAVTIGGVRMTNIKMDATPIDVTDADSNGLQELLAVEWSSRSLSFDVEGIYKDPVLRDIAMDPTASLTLSDMTFKFADALTAKDLIAGTFFMSSYEEGNPHEDAVTFKCSFTSSGTWTFS